MTFEMYVLLAILFVIAMVVSNFLGWRWGVDYGSKMTATIVIDHAAAVFKIPPRELAMKLKIANDAELNRLKEMKNG